jgi:hypothetical protein
MVSIQRSALSYQLVQKLTADWLELTAIVIPE